MSTLERQAHWQNVYQTKDEQTVSWFQERPDISLDLIHATGVDKSASIIDIGGGASRLVDALISEGFNAVSVLDLSEKALETSKARLGAEGAQVQWIVADITRWQPSQAGCMARPRGPAFSHRSKGPCCIRRARVKNRAFRWPRDCRYVCAGWPRTVQRSSRC